MRVREIMRTPPATISPDASVAEAARRALDEGVPGFAVVDATGRVLGVVGQRDLVAKHARVHFPTYFGLLGGIIPINTRRTDEELRRALSVTVRELMTDDPAEVSPDADVDDAASEMVEQDADPLLVMDDGRLVGTVGHTEIIRLLVVEETDDIGPAGR